MISPFASLSPSATAVLIGLAIVGAGFIGFVITRWIRNVLRHRLPQPFLGGGSNVEWAEQKRAEIAAGGIAYEPDLIDVSMHSDIEVTDHDSDFQSSGNSIGGNGSHSKKDSPKASGSINADELLHSWLSNSGHTDDDWAEKLFGDKEPTLGS